ncbi:hypothetical protein ACFL5O_09890 [Myxococcota bacterium]
MSAPVMVIRVTSLLADDFLGGRTKTRNPRHSNSSAGAGYVGEFRGLDQSRTHTHTYEYRDNNPARRRQPPRQPLVSWSEGVLRWSEGVLRWSEGVLCAPSSHRARMVASGPAGVKLHSGDIGALLRAVQYFVG